MIRATSTKNSFQEVFRKLLTNKTACGIIKMFQRIRKEERKPAERLDISDCERLKEKGVKKYD